MIVAGAIGLLVWYQSEKPLDTEIVFVLTDLEVKSDAGLLRYEHVTRLDCRILDEDGNEMARITVRRPGAVTSPTSVRLPKATYLLRIALELKSPSGEAATTHRLRRETLEGEKLTLKL